MSFVIPPSPRPPESGCLRIFASCEQQDNLRSVYTERERQCYIYADTPNQFGVAAHFGFP